MMRKITIILALASSIFASSQKCFAEDFQGLISGKQAPLSKQLKDLNSSWRQIAISGQYEMGDLMKSWTGIFGTGGYNNIYYTQGQTVRVNDETYVVAYRLPASGKTLTMKSLFESAMGSFTSLTGADCSSVSSSEKITPETTIDLSLLNLKTIGSLNDIRPFNLQEELAVLEKAEQESKAACEQAKLEASHSRVESNLRDLGVALHSYADNNDGKLPNMDNLETVKVALKDFVTDESVFLNPETLEPYLPNASLSNRKLADLDRANETVAFYEVKPAADGTIGVVYVDGFYQRIKQEDWEEVKRSSQLP
jgi:hypothetical protein